MIVRERASCTNADKAVCDLTNGAMDYSRFITFVLPQSGHCVIVPSGGEATEPHSSLPGAASNPQFRQRDGIVAELLRATVDPRFRQCSQCLGLRFRIVIDLDGIACHLRSAR